MGITATKITTDLDWSDLVLDQNTMNEIHQLKMKPGYKALFYGPAGTGKKLTATLLGKAAGLDVYKVDMSMLLSKYSGEAEKHLAGIFDEAATKNWILFFDEADALFGKRTEVKDAHDKYANQETGQVLKSIEAFPGTVVLATKTRPNIDQGFIRRLRSMVDFNKK